MVAASLEWPITRGATLIVLALDQASGGDPSEDRLRAIIALRHEDRVLQSFKLEKLERSALVALHALGEKMVEVWSTTEQTVAGAAVPNRELVDEACEVLRLFKADAEKFVEATEDAIDIIDCDRLVAEAANEEPVPHAEVRRRLGLG